MDLQNYSLAMVANHNVFGFVKQFSIVYKAKNISCQKIYMGDAGLQPAQKDALQHWLPGLVEFIDLPTKDFSSGIVTQSLAYRRIIDNRLEFLRTVFLKAGGQPVLQIDADTSIVANDFSLLDKNADVTLTVRSVDAKNHVLNMSEDGYPNLGVVFWNRPQNCLNFLDAWQDVASTLPPSTKQYEQNSFYHAMQSPEYRALKVQLIHCRHYNCYDPQWLDANPSIIHYKTASKQIIRDQLFGRCARLNGKLFQVWGVISNSRQLNAPILTDRWKNRRGRLFIEVIFPCLFFLRSAYLFMRGKITFIFRKD